MFCDSLDGFRYAGLCELMVFFRAASFPGRNRVRRAGAAAAVTGKGWLLVPSAHQAAAPGYRPYATQSGAIRLYALGILRFGRDAQADPDVPCGAAPRSSVRPPKFPVQLRPDRPSTLLRQASSVMATTQHVFNPDAAGRITRLQTASVNVGTT